MPKMLICQWRKCGKQFGKPKRSRRDPYYCSLKCKGEAKAEYLRSYARKMEGPRAKGRKERRSLSLNSDPNYETAIYNY